MTKYTYDLCKKCGKYLGVKQDNIVPITKKGLNIFRNLCDYFGCSCVKDEYTYEPTQVICQCEFDDMNENLAYNKPTPNHPLYIKYEIRKRPKINFHYKPIVECCHNNNCSKERLEDNLNLQCLPCRNVENGNSSRYNYKYYTNINAENEGYNTNKNAFRQLNEGYCNGKCGNECYDCNCLLARNIPQTVQLSKLYQNEEERKEFGDKINKIMSERPVHVHTVLLPEGVSPDDPRLRTAKLVRQNVYRTNKFEVPNNAFLGSIDPALEEQNKSN